MTQAKPGDGSKKILRQRGLRLTPQRQAILSALVESRIHPTASELHSILRKTYPRLSLDTVSRNLQDFCREGLAQAVESRDRTKRFDACLMPHHHFQCIECGKIVDFESPRLDAIRLPRELLKRFQVIHQRIHVAGLCDTCCHKSNSIKRKG